MEGLTEFIPFLVEQGNSHLWKDFLKTCEELKVFANKSNEIVPIINSLLNEPESRIFGLRLLSSFLTQCPKSVMNVQISNWLNQSIKGLTQSSNPLLLLSLTTLRALVEVSFEFPDTRKQTSQVFIPKIVDAIVLKLKESSHNCVPMLQCLFTCLFHYGKSCGHQKSTLEKIFVKLIVAERNSVLQVSKCFHLLAQIGAPGVDSINYKQNWHSQHLIVVNTLHFVLDQLFSEVNEIMGTFNQYSSEKRRLDLPSVNEEYPLIKNHKLSHLFCSLCQMLESMLLDQFPTCKKIHPEAIFGVICRALAVSCKSLVSNVSNSRYAILCQLCDIHISVIKLLNSLMLCSRTSLLPFSALVSKLFAQILKSTNVENWVQGRERPFSQVRETCYKCLLTWLTLGKSCSLTETQINSIVEAVIKDIKCEKKVVSLNLEQKTKSRGMKKTAVIESYEVTEVNSDICHAALGCIPLILRTPLSLVVAKTLQEEVVKLIFEIQRVLRYDQGLPPPYSDSKCRVQLYSALLALCISPHHQFPPPLHYANILFNTAASDTDLQVQRVCSEAVNSIAHILRPCAPSFDFHIELDSEIIPINAYPEPTVTEVRGLSKRPFQEFMSNTKNVLMQDKMTTLSTIVEQADKNSVEEIACHSLVTDKNILSRSVVQKSAENMPNSNLNDDLIALDDSSDESLILVDLKEKTDHLETSVSNDNHRAFHLNKLKDSELQSVANETIPKSKRQTRSSKLQTNNKLLLSEKNEFSSDCNLENVPNNNFIKGRTISDEIEVTEIENMSPQRRSNLIELDEVIVVDSQSLKSEISGDKNDLSNDVKIIEPVDVQPRRSKRTGRSPRSNDNCSRDALFPPNALTLDLDIIEVDEQNAPRNSTPRNVLDTIDLDNVTNSNVSTKPSSISNCDKTEYETQISDEISIIETSVPVLRRCRRNCKPVLNNVGVSDIEEVSLIQDDEDPPPKKMKPNRSSPRTKSSINSNENEGKEIYEVDINDSNTSNINEDEMLSSFIDSVPD